jgi:threonine dehydrogenase-like Zn-dependent dehydrogenase
VCGADTTLDQLRDQAGGFDLIVEAAGDAQLVLDALDLLARSGVLCVLGIDTHHRRVGIDSSLFVRSVIANRTLFGSVNAGPEDWRHGLQDLCAVKQRWPGVLDAMVGARVAPDRFAEAFAFDGIKATLCFDDHPLTP